jgi:hypothetical protein
LGALLLRGQISLQNLMASAGRLKLSRLLILAAILHLSFAIIVNVAGRYRLLPGSFNESGIGVSFAADSAGYLKYSMSLVEMLERGDVRAWIKDPTPLHGKLYSLNYAVLWRLSGYNTLSVEPLNLFYYLLILALVFALGREVFGHAAGILAASITALWPSLLLHTTQLLRDPLFLVLFLCITLVCASWLKRSYTLPGGLLAGLAGGMASMLVWLVRSQVWEVMLCAALLATALLIIRQLRERRFLYGNVISAALLCSILAVAPVAGKAFNIYSYPAEGSMPENRVKSGTPGESGSAADSAAAQSVLPTLPPGSPLPERISFIRHKFLFLYPQGGSNIDSDVRFNSLADILLYLPRAMQIGLFAPFPDMWFARGMYVGRAGRLLSGFETLLIYLIEALAVVALWRRRRYTAPWFLALFSLAGLLALGLVVPNLAALYRMRYGFWLLLIVLGAEGLRQFLQSSPPKTGLDKSRLS